jgi:hypothetical protein
MTLIPITKQLIDKLEDTHDVLCDDYDYYEEVLTSLDEATKNYLRKNITTARNIIKELKNYNMNEQQIRYTNTLIIAMKDIIEELEEHL